MDPLVPEEYVFLGVWDRWSSGVVYRRIPRMQPKNGTHESFGVDSSGSGSINRVPLEPKSRFGDRFRKNLGAILLCT